MTMRTCLVLLALAAGAPCAAQFTNPPFQPDTAQLTRAELSDVLALLCPGQEQIGQESGCRVCPASSPHAGARGDAAIVSAVRGHFLKSDSDDLLLDFNGCGPALLSHSSSGWFVDPSKGLPDAPCRKLASKSGRDALVCYEASSTPDQEQARLTFLYLPAEQKIDLLSAFDNTGGACNAPTRVVVQSAIQEVKFVSTGGKLTVSISARCRRGPLNQPSRRACARGINFIDDIRPAALFRTFRLDYTFTGDTFSLTPTTRQSKQSYDTCSAINASN